ncbi:hypothetical protein, partial [Escherichia coli]|uniref:hypothetical protein n=1 Tax=Escherichia coli TaxID=562 RepID=UPI001BD3B17A
MISMTKADLRLAVQRLISSSIVMLMSVISTHYDLSRISVGHYIFAVILYSFLGYYVIFRAILVLVSPISSGDNPEML